jgi:hypothetical protein
LTMHLVGPYMTTTNYKKRKQKKPTQSQMDRYEQEMKAHNKRMRQIHAHSLQMTLDEYIDYVHGKRTVNKKERSFEPYTPQPSYRRDTPKIPSLGTGVGVATKSETQRYTGDLIVGIGQMHKSNAVPIMRGTNEAIEIARMRRG